MPYLAIVKTYAAGQTPTRFDLDNICSSIEVFFNIIKLDYVNVSDNTINLSEKITDNTITNNKFENNSIVASNIEDSAITYSKIGDLQVNNTHIIDGSITTAKIKNNSLTGDDFDDASITPQKKNRIRRTALTTVLTSTGTYVSNTIGPSSGYVRPLLLCLGSANTLNAVPSAHLGAASGDIIISKNGTRVSNQVFKVGNLGYAGGFTGGVYVPSSCIFWIDTTEDLNGASRSYTVGIQRLEGTRIQVGLDTKVLEVL